MTALPKCVLAIALLLSVEPANAGELREFSTPHCRLFSEAAADEGRTLASACEQAFATSEAALDHFHIARSTLAPLEVVQLAASPELSQLEPPNEGAFFRFNTNGDEPARVFFAGTLDEDARGAMASGFMRYALWAQPAGARPWLANALADELATVRHEGSKAIFGLQPADFAFFVPGQPVDGAAFLNVNELPSAADLVAANAHAFANPDKGHLFYAGAWRLLQVLSDTTLGFHPLFETYLKNLTRGSAGDEAWARAVPAEMRPKLEEAYRRYAVSAGTARWSATVAAGKEKQQEHVLDDTEAHLLWVRIRLWNEKQKEAIEADLAAAQKLSPQSAAVLEWSARYQEHVGKSVEAEANYRRLVALTPRAARAWLALGNLLMRQELAKPPEQRAWPSVEEVVQRLQSLASTASELNFVARYYAHNNRPAQGLAFATRATALRPGCARCFDTLAILQFQNHEVAQAAKNEAQATNLLGAAAEAAMIKRLHDYQTLAQSLPSPQATPRSKLK